MTFVAYTALIDAVLVLIAWFALLGRKQPTQQVHGAVPPMTRYFTKYLVFSFFFLALLALSILVLQDLAQQIGFVLADASLWVSLVYMIRLALYRNSSMLRNTVMIVFLILAMIGSLYQIVGFAGNSISISPAIDWILQNMAPVLMYVVWVPVGIMFLGTAVSAKDAITKKRALMFALGLFFTTYSWAARLQLNVTSLITIAVVSVVGFALLVGGVIYRDTSFESTA